MLWKLLVLGALLELVVAERNNALTNFANFTWGQSGPGCTKQGRKCIYNATCSNGRCVCPPGQKGQGEIECVNRDKILCYVFADPHIVSFSRAFAYVSLPCRFRAARFVTSNANAIVPGYGHCSFEVWGTNQLLHGRYVIRHVHISVGIGDAALQTQTSADIFKHTTVYDVNDTTIYEHAARVEHRDNVWGTSQHQNIQGVDFNPIFDDVNNFAILDVPACGTRIKYRAYDPRRAKHQKQMPGLTIMAPNDAIFAPGYGDYPTAVCGTGKEGRGLYDNRAVELGLKDGSTAVLYDVLKDYPVQDDNTGMQARCNRAFRTFKTSSQQVSDTNFCGFLLTEPNVGKCIEDNHHQPIDIFSACLAYRQGLSKWCGSLKYIVAQCNNQKGWSNEITIPDSCAASSAAMLEEDFEAA